MINIVKYEEYNKYSGDLNEGRIPIAWARPSEKTIKILSFISEKEKITFIIIDFFFLIDIGVIFFSAYYDSEFAIVENHKQIAE